MTNKWNIKNAETKLSELIRAAEMNGPQIITKHGVDTDFLLSVQALSTFFAIRHW